MSLNPTGMVSYNWNYSNPNRDGYSLELWGTVVSLQEVQARAYNPGGQPGAPQFWPDGNPKMNIRMGLACPDGSLKSITFQKAGKKQVSGEKPSLHMQLFNLTNGDMMELIGKTLHLTTWPNNPNTGQTWGQNNPRLFAVDAPEDATPYELKVPLPAEFTVPELYANDGVSGGQAVQNQQQYSQPMYAQPMQPSYPPMQNTGYPPVQPTYTQAYTQTPQNVQVNAQAIPPQGMPQGMNPAIANAMMQQQSGQIYDDIPF